MNKEITTLICITILILSLLITVANKDKRNHIQTCIKNNNRPLECEIAFKTFYENEKLLLLLNQQK